MIKNHGHAVRVTAQKIRAGRGLLPSVPRAVRRWIKQEVSCEYRYGTSPYWEGYDSLLRNVIDAAHRRATVL